jgi:hypothetical protein
MKAPIEPALTLQEVAEHFEQSRKGVVPPKVSSSNVTAGFPRSV